MQCTIVSVHSRWFLSALPQIARTVRFAPDHVLGEGEVGTFARARGVFFPEEEAHPGTPPGSTFPIG